MGMRFAPTPFLLFITIFGMKLYSASKLTGILTSIIEPLPGVGIGATMYPGFGPSRIIPGCVYHSGVPGSGVTTGRAISGASGTPRSGVSSVICGSGINILSPIVYPIPGLST